MVEIKVVKLKNFAEKRFFKVVILSISLLYSVYIRRCEMKEAVTSILLYGCTTWTRKNVQRKSYMGNKHNALK